MSILRILMWVLLAYCLYKFVFDFLVPIVRVSRRMKKQMREFQQQTDGRSENYQKDNTSPQQSPPKEKAGDYIDFEEIK